METKHSTPYSVAQIRALLIFLGACTVMIAIILYSAYAEGNQTANPGDIYVRSVLTGGN